MPVLTKAELIEKGITKKDVLRVLRRTEARVNWYAKKFSENGFKCTEKFQAAWDKECARWDHFKATLAVLDA